ncbi:MAG: hypothetical protein H6780_02650 [Candidatus Nomurabacteria bacterium]|nr:MAG: hypothetical protein H6780_02650 [Candidatus Nomurabacteria bacterium]
MKTATQYYQAMREFDHSAAVALMQREHPELSAAQVDEAFDAWLQWMAGHAVNPHQEHTYVMLLGPVDEAFHAAVLCTRSYMQFCQFEVGFFVHHTPVAAEEAQALIDEGAVHYTIQFLREQFGLDLSPALVRWEKDFDAGKIGPSAVSCKFGMNSSADAEFLRHFGLTSYTERWQRAA